MSIVSNVIKNREGLYCIYCEKKTNHEEVSDMSNAVWFMLGFVTCFITWGWLLLRMLFVKPKFVCPECGTVRKLKG